MSEIETKDVLIVIAQDKDGDFEVHMADDDWEPVADWEYVPVITYRLKVVNLPAKAKLPVAEVRFPEPSQEPVKVEVVSA